MNRLELVYKEKRWKPNNMIMEEKICKYTKGLIDISMQ